MRREQEQRDRNKNPEERGAGGRGGDITKLKEDFVFFT